MYRAIIEFAGVQKGRSASFWDSGVSDASTFAREWVQPMRTEVNQ
jgi:hypothetical protein